MGIHGLNQLLAKFCYGAHITYVPMCNFAHKIIAIDAPIYVNKFHRYNNFIAACVDFLTTLRENLIHPIFIFDGVAPIEKTNERKERHEKRDLIYTRAKQLESDLDHYINTGEVTEALRIADNRTKKLIQTGLNEQKIRDIIQSMKNSIQPIPEERYNTFKTLLDIFGFQWITAESEAEFLCATLARNNVVAAVMTCDTDAIACLAPLVITDMRNSTFVIKDTSVILDRMSLTAEQFQDLCIMCRTDFNTRIPKIGPINSYELIRKYSKIEDIPENVISTQDKLEKLNYLRNREIFSIHTPLPLFDILPPTEHPDYNRLSTLYKNVESVQRRLLKHRGGDFST